MGKSKKKRLKAVEKMKGFEYFTILLGPTQPFPTLDFDLDKKIIQPALFSDITPSKK